MPGPSGGRSRRLCHTPARDSTPHPDRVGLLLVAVVAVVAAGPFGLVGGAGPAASPTASTSAAARATARTHDADERPARCRCLGQPVADRRSRPRPRPPRIVDVPIVPVTNFRSTLTSATAKDVAAVLAGTSSRFDGLALVDSEAPAILGALGVADADPAHIVTFADEPALAADLAKNRKRLAFLRADAVGPEVRALAWGGKALFGVDRVKKLADWPLTAQLPAPAAADAYDPATTWTLFAGGDILLDRGVYLTLKSRGANFAFDGGTADITGRCKDCSSMGWDLPYTKRTGNAGAFRHLDQGRRHRRRQLREPGAGQAALPRVRDQLLGRSPLHRRPRRRRDRLPVPGQQPHPRCRRGRPAPDDQEREEARHRGLRRGQEPRARPARRRSSRRAARRSRSSATTRSPAATTRPRPGSAAPGLSAKAVKADVAAARKAGADVVIVYPHWGTEYDPTPFVNQQKLAEMIIDGGADMVIGNHAHWAGAMEVYKGKPIWYALGNFVFDQTWSEPTMEGITLELTFRGADLVQVRMRPHIILDKAQPNFLDPAGAGKVVMGQVFTASKGLLPW